jgi:Ca-activated chloride channel homolog
MRSLLPLLEPDPVSATDDAEAGFGALSTNKGHLPLRAMDVRGRIDGLLAQVTLRQTFVNVTEEPLEATYIFPLPDRAAVSGFRMETGGRIIEGQLEERSKARSDYNHAIREGRRASIAEEERPGVFTLRVGNILPSEEATIEFTMAGVLPYANGEVTFRFPLVVAPRYIPGLPLDGPSVGDGFASDTDAVPDASRISPPVLLPGFRSPVRLSISVEIHDSSVATEAVRTSLHATCLDEPDGYRRISLVNHERLDRDFLLRFRLGGDAVHSSLSLHPDAGDAREGTFALTIIPPSGTTGQASRPRDIAFVLDHSGSMEGWKMVAARRALARMVETLSPRDQFCLIAFSDKISGPERGPFQLVAATDRKRFRAAEFLAGLEAHGGTEMAQPLELGARLLATTPDGRERILVLVTDGQVGNENQILRALGPLLAGVRVFTLGIDQAVNEGFLRRLAQLGAGSCELVESESRLNEMMDLIHRRIGAPVLSGLRINPEGLDIDENALVPDRLPDLFPDSPLLVLGRYRGVPRGRITVHATDANGTPSVELLSPSVRANPAIAAAWARGEVRKLEDRYAARQGDLDALEKSIVATSLRFGVLCRFTAYIALDQTGIANKGGHVHRIVQPVELPAGWASGPVAAGPMLSAHAALDTLRRARSQPAALNHMIDAPLSYTAPEQVSGFGPVDALYQEFAPSHTDVESSSDTGEMSIAEHVTATGTAPNLGADSPYELRNIVGQGAMGVVYRAFDRDHVRNVIVQLIGGSASGDSALRLMAEASMLTNLAHPSIVQLLEISERDGLIVVVYPDIPGRGLSEWIHSAGRPTPVIAARLVAILADALQYAHEHGLVHGDLSSNNVLMGDDGTPRLTRFRLTERLNDMVVGNPCRLAPELIRGDGPPTAQTDLYSLGVILYELLTGVLPYRGGGASLIQNILRGGPPSPRKIQRDVPVALEAICLKAMAPNFADRYASARELAEALRRFLETSGREYGVLSDLWNRLTRRKLATPRPDVKSGPAEPGSGDRQAFWK